MGGTTVTLELYREQNSVKGGWSSRCVTLGLAAHGSSPDVADKNLERVVRLFLAPFQRGGTLQDEVRALGGSVDASDDVQIILK
jgi:hypothetical protein